MWPLLQDVRESFNGVRVCVSTGFLLKEPPEFNSQLSRCVGILQCDRMISLLKVVLNRSDKYVSEETVELVGGIVHEWKFLSCVVILLNLFIFGTFIFSLGSSDYRHWFNRGKTQQLARQQLCWITDPVITGRWKHQNFVRRDAQENCERLLRNTEMVNAGNWIFSTRDC